MDNDVTVVFNGVRGSLVYLPEDGSHAPEPQTSTALWMVPDGWPAWTGSWVEPWEVQSATQDDGRGDRTVHGVLQRG